LAENNIKSLQIGTVEVWPYLLGSCAFALQKNMMKSSSKVEIAADQDLATWDTIASPTRKPVECAFGITKNRFSILKYGIRYKHEHDSCFLITACFILHNLCIESGDEGDHYLAEDCEEEIVEGSDSVAAMNIRKALLYYAVNISPLE